MMPTFSSSMITLMPTRAFGSVFDFSINLYGKPLIEVTIDPLGRLLNCGVDTFIANTIIDSETTFRGHVIVCSDFRNVPIVIRSVKIVNGARLCKVSEKRDVPFRYQGDPAWANDPYGIVANSQNPGTMANYGCSIAAADMYVEET